MSKEFKHLLSPLQISEKLYAKNRIVKAPQSTWFFEDDGKAGERAIGFYESLAAGGVGLLIVSAVTWHKEHPVGAYASLNSNEHVEGMKTLVEKVHAHNCPILCQLHHSGASAFTGHGYKEPIGPSTLSAEEIPCPPPVGKPTRGLTLKEIEEDKESYFAAAQRAIECGFDGIEVHCAHGYYLESFLSRVWNKREDQYGSQSMENRTRLIVELITGLRKRFGKTLPIGLRLNGQEWGAKNSMTIEEAKQAAKIFENAGVNYISVSGYGFGKLPFRYLPDYWVYPEPEEHMKPYVKDYKGLGLLIPSAQAIKKVVNIPVIAVGRMDEEKGEKVLEENKADLIAFGRYLWADAEFPNKLMQGRREDIVPCTRCGTCEDPPVGRPRRCRVNPAFGREYELSLKPAQAKKKILVIGGGPAGLECARASSIRGHSIALYEAGQSLGGKLPLASMIKGSEVENILSIIKYLKTQVGKLPISVYLNTKVTEENITAILNKEKPDEVVVATGGIYNLPNIPGIDNRKVSSVNSLSSQVKLPLQLFGSNLLEKLTKIFLPMGKNVVVVGGKIEGLQGATFLLKRNRHVTILEESAEIGKGIPPRFLDRLLPWLKEKEVQIFSEVQYEKITNDGVYIKDKNGVSLCIKGDNYMILPSQDSNYELDKALAHISYHKIGSANGSETGSLIVDALETARRLACKL